MTFELSNIIDSIPTPVWWLIGGLIGESGYLWKKNKRLVTAIRLHRDQRLDDRCWLDDFELYDTLNEPYEKIDLKLPPQAEFLKNCAQYHMCRSISKTPEEAAIKYAHVKAVRCPVCKCHPTFMLAGCGCGCHK